MEPVSGQSRTRWRATGCCSPTANDGMYSRSVRRPSSNVSRAAPASCPGRTATGCCWKRHRLRVSAIPQIAVFALQLVAVDARCRCRSSSTGDSRRDRCFRSGLLCRRLISHPALSVAARRSWRCRRRRRWCGSGSGFTFASTRSPGRTSPRGPAIAAGTSAIVLLRRRIVNGGLPRHAVVFVIVVVVTAACADDQLGGGHVVATEGVGRRRRTRDPLSAQGLSGISVPPRHGSTPFYPKGE